MSGYPILVDGSGLRALVVGAGPVGARRIAALLEVGASVHVVAPRLSPEAATLREREGFSWTSEPYNSGHIGDANLVFAATSSAILNLEIALDARRLGRLVNVASAASGGDFSTLAHFRDGPLVVAVSAGGVPAAAVRIRDFIRRSLGVELGGALLTLLTLRRARLSADDAAEWNEVSQTLITDDFVESVGNGEFEKRAERWR